MATSMWAILMLSYIQQAPFIPHSLTSHRTHVPSIVTPNIIGPGIVPRIINGKMKISEDYSL